MPEITEITTIIIKEDLMTVVEKIKIEVIYLVVKEENLNVIYVSIKDHLSPYFPRKDKIDLKFCTKCGVG